MKNMQGPYVSTGYEYVVGARSSDKFCTIASNDGIVKTVSKDYITVLYKGDDKPTKIKLGTWTTKEEGGKAFEYNRITHFKPKDKFVYGDGLAYVTEWYERGFYDRNKVIIRMGSYIMTGLFETSDTYEDSSAISRRVEEDMAIENTYITSIIVKANDNLTDVVRVGDKLKSTDTLMLITKNGMNNSGLDKSSKEILQNISGQSPKTDYKGKVSKIVCMYNSDVKDMSRSVKNLVTESDIGLMKEHDGHTGRVTSRYSIKGKPLLDGMVEIKIYIKSSENIGVGDKVVFANQLKSTESIIFDDIVTDDTGVFMDAMFSKKAIGARKVESPYDHGILARLMKAANDEMVNIYFN